MRKLMKASGHGLRHFFGARDSMATFKSRARDFKQAPNRVRKAEVAALTGIYALYKGSPMGLGKNIADSIRAGKWRYDDLKRQQGEFDGLLAGTAMSEEGRRRIERMLRNGSLDDAIDLSPHDAEILRGIDNDLRIAAGSINISAADFD